MIDIKTLHKEDDKFYAEDNGEIIEISEMFPIEEWDDPIAFKMSNIRGYEPMTAKELDTEEKQDSRLNDSSYYIEEKFVAATNSLSFGKIMPAEFKIFTVIK